MVRYFVVRNFTYQISYVLWYVTITYLLLTYFGTYEIPKYIRDLVRYIRELPNESIRSIEIERIMKKYTLVDDPGAILHK